MVLELPLLKNKREYYFIKKIIHHTVELISKYPFKFTLQDKMKIKDKDNIIKH